MRMQPRFVFVLLVITVAVIEQITGETISLGNEVEIHDDFIGLYHARMLEDINIASDGSHSMDWISQLRVAIRRLPKQKVPPNRSEITIHQDFAALFDAALVRNSSHASASAAEEIDGKSLPGIFIHPEPAGDATLTFQDIQAPAISGDNEHLFLSFHIGIRDDVPWKSASPPPNGVRFLVRINGELVFQEDLAQSIWRARLIDMRPWAGQSVSIQFATNAIDGMPNYDWSVFGDPLLLSLNGTTDCSKIPVPDAGIVFVQLECDDVVEVFLQTQFETLRETRQKGSHWIPVHLEEMSCVFSEISPPDAGRIVKTLYGCHRYALKVLEFGLSSPLVTTCNNFNIIAKVKNIGRGSYPGGLPLTLTVSGPDGPLDFAWQEERTVDMLFSGEEETAMWLGLQAKREGGWEVSLPDLQAEDPSTQPIRMHVFPEIPNPEEFPGAYTDIRLIESPDGAAALQYFQDASQSAFFQCLVKQNDEWSLAGAMYPIASGQFSAPGGGPSNEAHIKVDRFEDGVIHGRLGGHPIQVRCTPDPKAPRFHFEYEFTASTPLDLLALRGPHVLAGDRIFGVDKDFAIFPGLEYLEYQEASSSERDLAWPLSDRRVPAHYKIATPLMAVQAQGLLIALLWDANQEWAPGKRFPAARFLAPEMNSGYEHIEMGLFAPAVGEYLKENTYAAQTPVAMESGTAIRLDAWLALGSDTHYEDDSIVKGPNRGGLVLQAFQHYFDVFGFPAPSPQPRSWDEEKQLCMDGYLKAVWSEDPPGWAHCHGWAPGLFVGHALPQILAARDGLPETVRQEVTRRTEMVLDRAIHEHGPQYLWSGAGCHILLGELPFYYGYLPESMRDFCAQARRHLDAREERFWVWRPSEKKYEKLGVPGFHTLSQAARPSYLALRAARFTGDADLITDTLAAMRQMNLYDVPRGAQTWECPLFQPDILAAAEAIRAYTEAYRITGDAVMLAHARYWAWTGLPFLYLWGMDGFPTMRYNVISVIGSTFFTHSWLGLPVVWCGLVYAYALQDLALFDDSMDWKRIAQGITNSAMWQQYTEGPNRGTYPDSWCMAKNKANPADINPENILVNELRLRGRSPEIHFQRVPACDHFAALNASAAILSVNGGPNDGALSFVLHGDTAHAAFAMIAPVPPPRRLEGAGAAVADSQALHAAEEGWFYDAELRAVIIKSAMRQGSTAINVAW